MVEGRLPATAKEVPSYLAALPVRWRESRLRHRGYGRLHSAQVQQIRVARSAALRPSAFVHRSYDILGPCGRLPLALLWRVLVKHQLVARQGKVREPTFPRSPEQASQFSS